MGGTIEVCVKWVTCVKLTVSQLENVSKEQCVSSNSRKTKKIFFRWRWKMAMRDGDKKYW